MTSPPAPAADERLAALQQEFEHDASFSQVFVVLTVGATLIATLGLLANSLSSLVEHLALFGSSMSFVLGLLDGLAVVAFAVGIFVGARYIRMI